MARKATQTTYTDIRVWTRRGTLNATEGPWAVLGSFDMAREERRQAYTDVIDHLKRNGTPYQETAHNY